MEYGEHALGQGADAEAVYVHRTTADENDPDGASDAICGKVERRF